MNDQISKLFDMVRDKQDLHPDLAETVIDTGTFKMIQHPMVHTMYTKGFEAILNQTYLEKLKALEEYKADGRWDYIIGILIEKPHRLSALVKYGDNMPDFLYWATVSDVWTSMEYFHDDLDVWGGVLTSERTGRENMMTEEERDELAALPDDITIWRGGSDDGWSWTLDLDVAEWFSRRWDKGHLVHEHTIPKSEVIALLNHRSEHEIIWTGKPDVAA